MALILLLDALRLTPLSMDEEKVIITKFDIGGQRSGAIFNSVANPFFRADYLTADHAKVESGFGIFLALSGEGSMIFDNDQPLEIKARGCGSDSILCWWFYIK